MLSRSLSASTDRRLIGEPGWARLPGATSHGAGALAPPHEHACVARAPLPVRADLIEQSALLTGSELSPCAVLTRESIRCKLSSARPLIDWPDRLVGWTQPAWGAKSSLDEARDQSEARSRCFSGASDRPERAPTSSAR